MQDTPNTPALLTIQEVADALRVHYRTAYRLVTAGSIKAIKIGSQWRVAEASLLEFIEHGWKEVQVAKKETKGPKQLKLPLE
ncbi:helix-turn-helix domain-containing protein [Salidesulfovibrio onnuriiensis]|uniref:helix-turn-helix domain-containing protein n=1 Tax=Salidesulfovibrio onnuriiensis TaxID=2583823 RepID=UPI0011C825DE|nr:helix-turn-helix domain-containing protein [Salidesulfovibrio onnuriiensis]